MTGDLGQFFLYQPAMGLVSMAVRAPAVAIAHASGGDFGSEYQAGAAACLAIACAIAVWLAYQARRLGASVPAVLAVLAVWLVTILWTRALHFGHPEEPLAAVLSLGAIVLAATRRPLAAGIVLALAIGTKEWAFLIAPAVLLAAGNEGWRRAAVPAVVGALALTAVMAAGNPNSFRTAHAAQRVGDQHTVKPPTIWFRLGHKRVGGHQGDVFSDEVYPPKLIGRWCRPFVIGFALTSSLVFWRRRGFDPRGAFALAAFVLLARALFDTQTFSYHLIPMLIAVGAWEVFALKRLPFVAIAATIALQLTTRVVESSPDISSNALNAIYLAWTLPLFALLAVATFRAPSPTGGTRWSRDRLGWGLPRSARSQYP